MTAAGRAVGLVGCVVVSTVGGLVEVDTSRGRLRVGLGGALLARVAADRAELPRPGDRVALTQWPDGPVTLDRVLARGDSSRDRVVVPLRSSQGS